MIVVIETNIVASATYWRGKPALHGGYRTATPKPIRFASTICR
jgi:hypothetical protein